MTDTPTGRVQEVRWSNTLSFWWISAGMMQILRRFRGRRHAASADAVLAKSRKEHVKNGLVRSSL
jgi:hypothetical protein